MSSKFHFKYLTKSLHGLYYEQSVTELWSFDSYTDQDRYCFSKVCAGLVLTCCVLGLETTLMVPLTAQAYKRLLLNCWDNVGNTGGRHKVKMDLMLQTPEVNTGRVNLLVCNL